MATVEAAARAEVSFPPARLFIGGQWVEPESGRTLPVENPATKEALCEVAAASVADVNRAVATARSALDGDWRWKPPTNERGQIIDEFARLETLNNGKPIFGSATWTCRSARPSPPHSEVGSSRPPAGRPPGGAPRPCYVSRY